MTTQRLVSLTVRARTFDVLPGDYTHYWESVRGGQWEPQLFDVLDRWITPATTVLDVGAWQGAVTLYASPLVQHVYAFEPDPVAAAALGENVRANGYGNVTLISTALSGTTGTAVMNAPSGRQGDSRSTLREVGGEGWKVETTTLTDFLGAYGINGPLFIKMDVEGYEYDLIPNLVGDLQGLDFTLHLALHPYWRGSDARGRLAGAGRRLRMAADNAALARALTAFAFYDEAGRRLSAWRALVGAAAAGARRRGSVLTVRNA